MKVWVIAEQKDGELRRVSRELAAKGERPAKVASGCPFCLIMLDEGVGAKGIAEELKPVDVLELVAARVSA